MDDVESLQKLFDRANDPSLSPYLSNLHDWFLVELFIIPRSRKHFSLLITISVELSDRCCRTGYRLAICVTSAALVYLLVYTLG